VDLDPSLGGGITTILLVILIGATGWFLPITLAYLAAIVGRTSRLRLHADASGLIVLNLLRRYRVTWDEVRGIWADEGYQG
jgi:Bacterial PH domain